VFTIKEIITATGGRLTEGPDTRKSYKVSTDTRTIAPGDVFIALKGEIYDGHNFIKEAIEKGAAGCIVSRDMRYAAEGFFITVASTLKALGHLASYNRKRFNIPIIGITGSNGKTTTKDLIAKVLSVKFNVLKTSGTRNNLVGVPLTLLGLNSGHQVCVLEMGTSFPGEIRKLSQIAAPNIGIITNIGPSHMEFLKDLQAVYKEKSSIFADFRKENLAVWNGDDPMLVDLIHMNKCRLKTFGLRPGCDFQAADIQKKDNNIKFLVNGKFKARLNMLSEHNVYNALCAITIGSEFGIEMPKILKALSDFEPPHMRMQLIEGKDILIINDCYNSNPLSMKSAIKALADFKGRRKILASGDMLELGELSAYFHHYIGELAAKHEIDIFVGVGELSKAAVQSAVQAGMKRDSVCRCKTSKEAGHLLMKIARPGDVILIKGSRAIKMERTLECFTTYSTR